MVCVCVCFCISISTCFFSAVVLLYSIWLFYWLHCLKLMFTYFHWQQDMCVSTQHARVCKCTHTRTHTHSHTHNYYWSSRMSRKNNSTSQTAWCALLVELSAFFSSWKRKKKHTHTTQFKQPASCKSEWVKRLKNQAFELQYSYNREAIFAQTTKEPTTAKPNREKKMKRKEKKRKKKLKADKWHDIEAAVDRNR